jgi:transcription elongation GreA/GreB family factor
VKRDEIFVSTEDGAERGVVTRAQLPRSVVALGTVVEYAELPHGRMCSFELVLPAKADVAAGRVSVLSPVGRALLGKKLGSVVEIRLPCGDKRQVKVMHLQARGGGGD